MGYATKNASHVLHADVSMRSESGENMRWIKSGAVKGCPEPKEQGILRRGLSHFKFGLAKRLGYFWESRLVAPSLYSYLLDKAQHIP